MDMIGNMHDELDPHFWDGCPDVERVAGRVSGQPTLVGSRILAGSVPENYEGAIEQGATPDEAIAEVLESFPGAGADRIRRVMAYYYAHQPQHQR